MSGVTSTSYDDFHASLTSLALKATRSAALLPGERDLAYSCSVDSDFAQSLSQTSSRILGLTSRLIALVDSKGKGKQKLREEDVVDNFATSIVDVVDVLLEGTDTALDVVLGKVKEPAIYVNPNAPPLRNSRAFPAKATNTSSEIEKPQLHFLAKTKTWKHTPVSKVPYPEQTYRASSPVSPRPLSETPLHLITSVTQYREMLPKLREVNEIAVDLEHHDYRTYNGILCLMQISTRQEDFIIDLLDPEIRLEIGDGDGLRQIFLDPSIAKVFHGAEHDIYWLQRDFELHIVNLFDTFHASKVLEFPSHSLSSLMQLYCSITPDKQYQLADWRVRPLPRHLVDYARSDTHYLLYIYDELRNALLDRGRATSPSSSPSSSSSREASPDTGSKKTTRFLRDVLKRSHATASKVQSFRSSDSGAGLAKKWNKPLWALSSPNGDGEDEGKINLTQLVRMQREVYISLFRWRDEVAKDEDESVRYIMPNHHLFQLAEHPPASLADLLRAFSGSGASVVVKKRAEELLGVIKEAVVRGMAVPTASERTSKPMIDSNALPNVTVTSNEPEDATRLWGTLTTQESISHMSTLLGEKRSTKPLHFRSDTASSPSSVVKASSSVLFGKNKQKVPMGGGAMAVDSTNFQDIVSRIHSTLIVVPSAAPTTDAVPPSNAIPDTGVPGMVVEIPYVPAAERTTLIQSASDVSTTDLVKVGIGRSTNHRRKRKFAGGQVEEYDFAAEGNMLDSKPVAEKESNKKRKKDKGNDKTIKGKGVDTSAFPRPPQARSEMRKGNVTGTFK